MGGICCPIRIDDNQNKGTPGDHKSIPEEVDIEQDNTDMKLKLAGRMTDMFAKINERKRQVELFKQRFKDDILNGKYTVQKPIENLPCGVLGTFEDLNDDIGSAYFSKFTQELLEYSFTD